MFLPQNFPSVSPYVSKFPLRVSLCVDRLVSHFLSFPSESFPRTVDCDHTNFPSNAHLLLGVSTQKCFYDLLSARLRIGKIFLTNYLIESNGRIREPWVWKNWKVLRSVKWLSNRALGKLKAKLTFIPLSNFQTTRQCSSTFLDFICTVGIHMMIKNVVRTKPKCLQQLHKTKHAICWKHLAENAALSSVQLDADPRPEIPLVRL